MDGGLRTHPAVPAGRDHGAGGPGRDGRGVPGAAAARSPQEPGQSRAGPRQHRQLLPGEGERGAASSPQGCRRTRPPGSTDMGLFPFGLVGFTVFWGLFFFLGWVPPLFARELVDCTLGFQSWDFELDFFPFGFCLEIIS